MKRTDRLVRAVLLGLLLGGIVLTILIPTVSIDQPRRGSKAGAQNNLGQIAKSHLAYTYLANGNPRTLTAQPGDTVHDVAYLLAREVQLNEASVWVIRADERLAGISIPRTVILGDVQTGPINPEFAKLPLSVVFAANISANAPPETTPVAWTRGLQSDGTWSSDSPWRGQGGHIAYLDGHVEWAEKFSTVKYGTTIPTTNIREALPPGAVILSAEPAKAGH